MPHIMLKLSDGFQKWLAFNISYRSADFDNGNPVFIRGFCAIEAAFDFICNMRDYLYGSSSKVSMALFLQNGPINFSGSYIGIFIQAFINESFIMAKIKVGLGSIVCYEDFSMLNRVHGSGINVDVRVKFLHCDLKTSCL